MADARIKVLVQTILGDAPAAVRKEAIANAKKGSKLSDEARQWLKDNAIPVSLSGNIHDEIKAAIRELY